MPNPNDPEHEPNAAGGSPPSELRGLLGRLQSLQSAWRILAPSCLAESGRGIVAEGRELRELLNVLADHPAAPGEANMLRARESMERLTHAICEIAFEIPIPQLRATLPGFLQSDRSGVLDLLDLLSRDAFETAERFGAKLGVIDYLITLICTEGDTQARFAAHDPAMLTPSLRAICQQAESEADARLPDFEAEFFSASTHEAGCRDELQLRTLRARKTELGRCYFAPSMLRAILTYNITMLQCAAAEVWEASDWCDAPEAPAAPRDSSVFDCEAVQGLHTALLRRFGDAPPETDPVGRVAWALDLEYLTGDERSLLTAGAPSRENLKSTIVLVGLLCRSLNVLAIELQDIGISPDAVSELWCKELDELLKGQVNGLISGDAYKEACQSSELRNKFLYAPMVDVHRENRGSPRRANAAGTGTENRQTRKEARGLASEALSEGGTAPAPAFEPSTGWRTSPWLRIVLPATVTTLILVFLGLQLSGFAFLNRDLDRFSGDQLETISPYLERGHRNGEGLGPAFVGRVGDDWLTLKKSERETAAQGLVDALKQQGVTQVMIYDDEQRLRVQSLGTRVRVL